MADGRKNNSGKVGNRGGRKPKADEERMRDKVSPYIPGAIEEVARIAREGKHERDRLAASKLLIEYYAGKPRQAVDMTTEEKTPTSVKFEFVYPDGTTSPAENND